MSAIMAMSSCSRLTAPGLYRYYAGHRELVQALVSHLYDELAAVLGAARERRPADEPGKPVADAGTAPEDAAHQSGWRFGGVVLGSMVELWRCGAVRAPADLDPEWAAQLEEVREHLDGEPVPLEVIYVFVACWARLYGAVAVEVFGHLDFALTDPGPLFERTVGDILTLLGAPAA